MQIRAGEKSVDRGHGVESPQGLAEHDPVIIEEGEISIRKLALRDLSFDAPLIYAISLDEREIELLQGISNVVVVLEYVVRLQPLYAGR